MNQPTTQTTVVEQIEPGMYIVRWHGWQFGGCFYSRANAERSAAALEREPAWSANGWIAQHRAREQAA